MDPPSRRVYFQRLFRYATSCTTMLDYGSTFWAMSTVGCTLILLNPFPCHLSPDDLLLLTSYGHSISSLFLPMTPPSTPPQPQHSLPNGLANDLITTGFYGLQPGEVGAGASLKRVLSSPPSEHGFGIGMPNAGM